MDTSKVLPLDLAAVQADDELLASLGSGQLSVDDAVSRGLLAWRQGVDAAPLPALLDVDTALVLVGARRRSLVSRALRWLRRLVSDNPE